MRTAAVFAAVCVVVCAAEGWGSSHCTLRAGTARAAQSARLPLRRIRGGIDQESGEYDPSAEEDEGYSAPEALGLGDEGGSKGGPPAGESTNSADEPLEGECDGGPDDAVGHQGSDPNAKDPTGIWSSFQRVGGEENQGGHPPAVGSQLRTVANVWGQAACRRRTQGNVTFRLSVPEGGPGDGVVATCEGTTFCGKSEEGHHMTCGCEGVEEVGPVTIEMEEQTSGRLDPIFKGTGTLPPGQYRVKFTTAEGEEEVLQGMHGVEQYRPLTVLPPPGEDAVLLMSDIDGTLIGSDPATDEFFWIWNEQYRPRGAHLVYNTGRPFPSAHRLITEERLKVPTALVCSEGTEIYWFGCFGAEDVEPDHEWREILMLSWDYEAIKGGVQRIVEQMAHEVNDAQYLYEMCGQPMIVINVADKGKADNMIGKISHELIEGEGLRFQMVCSSGGGNFFILITPKGASKGSAALHVSKRLGFNPDRVMVAGDGENDVPLFEATVDGTDQGFKGVIVGNAVEGLRTWVGRSPSSHKIHRSLSEQALGVLDGLSIHFPATPPRSESPTR
uniref:Sucrose phosphatase-like domain-containing protein n=1 Tax=Hemiselmis tepida TaxID=464990 RepID=A0A7S0W527_9CRYP|mmetsp:Transcript_5193/g.13147  ORF Transcript_5193/g.13147 Transcript_5193/m.13147 type:complete len:558 (+) Transcript_5193:227-1900(+)